MKKITSLLLTLAMLATAFTAVPVFAATADSFAGGTGTTDNPFLISNAAELQLLNDVVNSGASYTDAENATKYYYAASYQLTADIDFENGEWTPLGQALPTKYSYSYNAETGKTTTSTTRTPEFKGTFDGADHVIKNVKITNSDTSATSKTSQYVGFFGRTNGATIKNLGLDNIDIQWKNHDYTFDTYVDKTGATKDAKERAQYYGAFVGGATNTDISNCYVVNSKVMNTNRGTNDDGVAGFVGSLDFYNTISTCYVYNTQIQAAQNKQQAGFAGNCLSGTNAVNNSYAAQIIVDRESNFSTTYGFEFNNRTDVTTNTATNCWSTLADAQGTFYGTYGYATQYSAAKSLGENGATAEALINAMLETGLYAQDPEINGGYPYFKAGFDGTAATEYAGGSGNEDDPYLISTPGQLLLASRQVNSGVARSSYFKLLNDIDFNNQPWEPIGYSSAAGNLDFCGGFDGNNHVVKNLSLGSDIYYYCGFFGLLTGAKIKNLGIDNFQLIRSNVKGSYIRVVGGFAGAARNTSEGVATEITNCYVKNSSVQQKRNYSNSSNEEYTDMNLGGFIGLVDIRYAQTAITNCYVDNISLYTAIQGRACGFIGGLAEYTSSSAAGVKLTNCYAANITNGRGAVTTQIGFGYTGGSSNTFNANKIVLSNCYSTFTTAKGTDANASTAADNANLYFGTEGASMSTIATALANLEGWQDGTAINDGYPALSWEPMPGGPDYLIKSVKKEIVNLNISGSSGSYTANPSSGYKVTVEIDRKTGVTDTANVYVAGYDIDGRLTGAQKATVNLDDFSFTADIDGKDAQTVKVFLWDEENDAILKPYQATTSMMAPLDEVWYFSGTSGGSGSGGGTPVIPTKKTRIVVMGDSIMDSMWNTSSYSWRKYGWEAYLGNYLTDDTTIIKHGHSGQTIKMFMEGRSTYHVCSWDTIKTQFSSGDYVLLALGTNDQGCLRRYLDGSYEDEVGMVTENGEERAYYSEDWFKTQYKQIIADVKAKGATIILLTPPTQNGYNKTTGKFEADGICPLSRTAIKEVAAETGVECLDITQLYTDTLNKLIDDNVYTAAEMCTQKSGSTTTGPGVVFVDSVHLNKIGAELLAKTVAEALEARTTGMEKFIEIPAE